MRIFLCTIDLLLSFVNLLHEYEPKFNLHKRHIKFIHNNKKCYLTFSSHKCDVLDVEFIKRICFFVESKKKFVWAYNANHPYVSTKNTCDYVTSSVISQIIYYIS